MDGTLLPVLFKVLPYLQDKSRFLQIFAMAQTATLSRSQTIQRLIQRVFGVAYSHLSELQDRTVEEYCKDGTVPKYIAKFFSPKEKEVLASVTPVEEYDVKLSYKLLKNCCGLKSHKHESWGSEKDNDTFEFLITLCWTEYLSLSEASAMSGDSLNSHIDRILDALILLIEKVEKKKKVYETFLKSELMKHIGEELDSYDNGPISQHIYTILCQHAVHQILVMVYMHLNQLNGMSLSNYLNYRKINLMPQTLFSNERKFLEGNPRPQEMPFNILYRVVKRVCFSFDRRKRDRQDNLESTLHDLKKEYTTPLRKEEQYNDKCMNIFKLLDKALEELCRRTGKDRRLIIGNLTQEPFRVESLPNPFELPTSTQFASSPHQSSQSPEDLPAAPKIPKISTPPCKSVTHTAPVADTLTVEEINICVLFRVMRPGGLIARTLALVFEALQGDTDSIKSRKTWKNFFTSEEKNFLQNINDKSKYYIDLSQRDITLLCKLLRHGCPSLSTNDDIWVTSNDSLEYYITFIKKERNKLAHEVSCIKTEDLKNTLKIIEDSLIRILERTESKLKDSEQSMKANLIKQRDEVNNEMQKISQISQAGPHDYSAEIKDMYNKVKTAVQEELNQPHLYRENLQYMSPISGSSDPRHKSLTINEVFVERELKDEDVIKAEGTYRMEDMLFCHNTALASCRAFIVHGRPGDGKTSICKYAFYLWSRNIQESSMKGVDLLVYIPCRYVTTKSLSTYLRGKLPRAFAGIKNDDIIPLLQEPQVLFVIDGYDEAGEEAKGLIDEILTTLPESRMIFTTKTQWMPKLLDRVKSVTSRYKVLSMVKMTEEKRHQCIRKIFDALGQKSENCIEFLTYLHEMKENVKSLILLPLTLSLLALLWIEDPGKAKKTRTLAQLYHKLIDLILERVTKQLGKDDSFHCREWMISLGELAWNNLKKNKHCLSEEDLTPLKRKAQVELGLGVDGNKHMVSSLLYCEIQDNLVGSTKSWTFTLASQQEYFAAEYIVDTLKKDKTAALKSILELKNEEEDEYKKRLQRLVPVLEFICELLVIRDGITEARLEEITEIMSVKEPWSFIALEKMFSYFMEEHAELQPVVKKMFMCEQMDMLDGFEPQSTLWVLRKTSVVLQRDVTVVSPVSDLQQLKPMMDYMLSKSHNITLLVDVDKVSNISSVAKLIEQERFKSVKLIFRFWKPLCISEVIMKWPYSRPLHLLLHPEFFPLVWWEALMSLLTMKKPVTKLICNPDSEYFSRLVCDGSNRLGASLFEDKSLSPTEVVIHTVH